MRSRCALAAVVLPLGFFAANAEAQVVDLARHGVWNVYGGRSNDGTPKCGLHVSGSEGRSLHVKWFLGTPGFVMQAFKTSWRIPAGTSIPVAMQVDNGSTWVSPGATGNRDMVQWRVGADDLRRFAAQFRAGMRLTISFPSGSEEPWIASLAGSSNALDVFFRCVMAQVRPPEVTQPFASGAPSQPHSGAVPSQPFRSQSEENVPLQHSLPVGRTQRL